MLHRMMDRIRLKLVDQRGDTMVEALTAILIAVLGATMLATRVIASTSVAARSERALDASYKAETTLNTSAASSANISVRFPSDPAVGDGPIISGSSATTKVMLYQATEYECYRDGNH